MNLINTFTFPWSCGQEIQLYNILTTWTPNNTNDYSVNYDYVVLADLKSDNQEQKIRKIKPSQKILSLDPYINSDGPPELKETQNLIEKPFAILTLFGNLEIENQNQYVCFV